MTDNVHWIEERIREATEGDEDAFHSLVEAPSLVWDLIRSSWSRRAEAQTRELLIEVIWQQRDPVDIPLLLADTRGRGGNGLEASTRRTRHFRCQV